MTVGGAPVGGLTSESMEALIRTCFVRRLGSVWTVDEVVTDPSTGRAVIEWTHFKSYENRILRGDEWYRFDAESGLISEIRAYYASPQDPSRRELVLDGFDYAGRGYPLEAPIRRVR